MLMLMPSATTILICYILSEFRTWLFFYHYVYRYWKWFISTSL